MCGIFAAIRMDGHFCASEYETFRNAIDLVSYRGPDDSGYLALTEYGQVIPGAPFTIYLGHRRLSILDLSSAGHQPMTDGNGLWLIYNGEIFNFIELRTELERLGHTFTSSTDTEVILKLYRECGEAGFAKMNGMWAIVLVDLPRRRVVISRDRFAIKPLHVAEQSGVFYFASEIKQIAAVLPSVQPNLEVMSRFMDQALHGYSQETFYEQVRRVPAASNIVLNLKTRVVTTAKYWNLKAARSSVKEAAAAEVIRELLLDSIQIRLRSDVKVGILLSGGLDSTAITMLAHSQCPDLETFSVIYNGPGSEEPFIDEVSQAVGRMSHKIAIQPDSVLESLQQVLFHHDEPATGFSMVAQYLLMQSIRRHSDSTVLLSGQGADEILLGYLKYYYLHLRELFLLGKYGTASAEILGALVKGTVWRQFHLGKSRRYRSHQRPREFLRPASDRLLLGSWENVQDAQIADIERFSIPALTHYEDRSAMAFGLEVRHPFLDHRLVEYAVRLPSTQKIHRGWLKYLLRQAVPEMPAQIRWRRDKQGFEVPEGDWLRNDFKDTVERVFARSVLDELGLLDSKSFLAFYRDFCAGSRLIWHNEISRVLMAELWAQQFIHAKARCPLNLTCA